MALATAVCRSSYKRFYMMMKEGRKEGRKDARGGRGRGMIRDDVERGDGGEVIRSSKHEAASSKHEAGSKQLPIVESRKQERRVPFTVQPDGWLEREGGP